MPLSNSIQSAATLQLTGAGIQERPAIAQLQDGDYLVAWLQPSGTDQLDIHAQRCQSDGGRVDTEFTLNDAPLSSAFYSDMEIAGLATGGFVVTWGTAQPGATSTAEMHYARYFDSQGHALGASFAISDHAAANLHGNAMAALAGGGFVAGWIENPSPSNYTFDIQTYAASGAALGSNVSVTLPATTSTMYSSTAAIDLAAAPDGGFYAVWIQYVSNTAQNYVHTDLMMERFDSLGRAVSSPTLLLSSGTNQLIDDVSAKVQPGTGNVVVEAQGHLTDNSSYLLTQRFDASGHATSDSQYTFPGSNARAVNPELVMFADGSWQTSWSELDFGSPSNSNVYQRAYDANGLPTGSVGTSMWSTYSSTQPHDITSTWDGGMALAAEVDKFDSAHDIWEQRFFPSSGAATRETTGTAGIDTFAFSGTRESYGVVRSGDTVTVQGPTGTDILHGIERISFAGLDVAFDIEGHAGAAYRLYQAAFNRTPDLPGLGFHIHDLDAGLSETGVAEHFIASPEFQATYGSLDNTAFVTQLYANVLHRAPDSGGLAFHLNDLQNGVSRAEVLVHFSDSPENEAQVMGAVSNGIAYIG